MSMKYSYSCCSAQIYLNMIAIVKYIWLYNYILHLTLSLVFFYVVTVS